MATTETYTLDAFIADLDRITREETSGERITERAAPLLARLVQNPSSIPADYLKSTPQSRGRYMLHRAPRFNVTSVIWRPGDTAGAHNPDSGHLHRLSFQSLRVPDYSMTSTRVRRASIPP